MRRLIILLSAFAIGTLSARALPTAAQIKVAFDAVDTKRDGVIDAAEWDRASFALFRAADKNNNDLVDADELQGSSIAQDTFLHADTNHDGRLSIGEFMELRRAIFQVADIDRGEKLDAVEFELLVVMEQVGWVDQNQNGLIELSELRDSLTKAFAQIDVSHDGQLTPAETPHMPAKEFKAFDKNGDGQLSVDEFVSGYRKTLLGEN